LVLKNIFTLFFHFFSFFFPIPPNSPQIPTKFPPNSQTIPKHFPRNHINYLIISKRKFQTFPKHFPNISHEVPKSVPTRVLFVRFLPSFTSQTPHTKTIIKKVNHFFTKTQLPTPPTHPTYQPKPHNTPHNVCTQGTNIKITPKSISRHLINLT